MQSITLNGKPLYPSKVVCIGRNYAAHIEELNNEVPTEPVIFIKPNSAISQALRFNQNEAIHFEGEITFLVQNNELAAVGFGLDLTKRELQSRLKEKSLPWERAKSFDGAALFSEFVSFSGSTEKLRLELSINGELIQSGGCELMLYKPADILKEVRSFLTLEDGDLIMTGTPKGVGAIQAGDVFTGRIFNDQALLVEHAWTVLE